MSIPILLTSSIDPNNCVFLERSLIEDRKNDYLKSIKLWLTKTNFDLVYVDNSGYDISFLKEEFKSYGDRIEYHSLNNNNFDRSLGKSYGELEIINYALKNSYKIKQFNFFLKSTGRYFLSNIENTLSKINLFDYDFIGYLSDDIMHTGFLGFNINFYKDFYKKNFNSVNPLNDSNQYYLEHFCYYMAGNTEKKYFIDKLGIEGISGTFNSEITWMK